MTSPSPAAGALAPAVEDAKALTAWEGLALRIAAAEQESATKVFDYDDPHDRAAARSWLASLRRIKGSIERARKEAKAVHLERGRLVDSTAKTLEASVTGLIEPHDQAIKRIEAIEQARVDGHRSVLVYIEGLTSGVTTSIQALERLEALEALDTSTLEEFATAGANRAAEQSERLQELYAQLLQQETDAAELQALREEKARREAEEAAEALRLEGEQRAAARLAAEPVQLPAPPRRVEPVRPPAPPCHAGADAEALTRSRQIGALMDCLRGKTASQVAAELLDGTFHRAVTVNVNLLIFT